MSETAIHEPQTAFDLNSLRATPRPNQDVAVNRPAPKEHLGRSFDVDAFHAMEQRDNALVADEILYGGLSNKFCYQFKVAGTEVEGVSVIGAKHLAHFYGGIKHRIIASVEKRDAIFTFTSYPNEGQQMFMSVARLEELAKDPDFYRVLVEVTDIKKGNTKQVEKTEMRFEKKRDGDYFERPHFALIAQSKAYRNAVVDVLPQDVVHQFIVQCRSLGKEENITEGVIETKREAMTTYCENNGIKINAAAVAKLNMAQIGGLHRTLKSDGPSAFCAALERVNCLLGMDAKAGANKAKDDKPKAGAAAGAGGGGKSNAKAGAQPQTAESTPATDITTTATKENLESEGNPPPTEEHDPGFDPDEMKMD